MTIVLRYPPLELVRKRKTPIVVVGAGIRSWVYH